MADKNKEEAFKKQLNDETLQLIKELALYMNNDLCGVIDQHESVNFVEVCFDIAGKPCDWEQS